MTYWITRDEKANYLLMWKEKPRLRRSSWFSKVTSTATFPYSDIYESNGKDLFGVLEGGEKGIKKVIITVKK